MKYFACTFAICVALCPSRADSQTFKTLVGFTGTGGAAIGANQFGSLTLGGTTLYGMTSEVYASNGDGSIFSFGTAGTSYQNLVSFTGTSGSANGFEPFGNLTLSGTTLYGMTFEGGANEMGNVFSVSTGGTNYQSLLSFTGTGGSASGGYPSYNSLIFSGTTLYGMTPFGGADGYGNIFSVGTNGTNYQNLISFTGSSGSASGQGPQGSLTLSGTTLYGMTVNGGANGEGNIFSVGTNGASFRNLVSFTGTSGSANGALPHGSLTLSATTLYGMTNEGGEITSDGSPGGSIFSVGTDGTNYQPLVSFTGTSGSASGEHPLGSLTLNGTTLYGMTEVGGTDGYGNIFGVGIDGSDYQDLYSFTDGTDGDYPYGDLTLSSGTLFGMTPGGAINIQGPKGDGTLFELVLPTPAPEPGTLALSGAVAVALVSHRRRRKWPRHANRPLDAQIAGVPALAGAANEMVLTQRRKERELCDFA